MAVIQESKLTLNSRTTNIQNFTTVRKACHQCQGLLTLVHKLIYLSRRPVSPDTLADPHLEEFTITAELGNTDLIITNVYIPPASSFTGGCNPSLDHLLMMRDTSYWDTSMLARLVVFMFYRFERHYIEEHGVWL